MPSILLTVLIGASAIAPALTPKELVERWSYADHICWEGEMPDRRAVSDTEVKVACITVGIFTERLIEAGYCLHPNRNEWERC